MDGQEYNTICINWSSFKSVVNFFPKVYFSGLFFCYTRSIEEHKIEEFDKIAIFFRRSVFLQLHRLA